MPDTTRKSSTLTARDRGYRPASGMPARGRGNGSPRKDFEPGNMAALKHGANHPDTVAPIAETLAESLAEAAPWTSSPAFAAAVTAWATAEAKALLLRQHFDKIGLVDDDGNPRPGLVSWERTETRAASLRADLGLTPMALGKLLQHAAQVATATADHTALEQLRAEGRRILASRAQPEPEATADD